MVNKHTSLPDCNWVNCYFALENPSKFSLPSVRATKTEMVRGRKNPLFFGLAGRLKLVRRQAGLKRLPLAAKAGLATATGRDIETGERIPTVGTVARLAFALGVAAGWLAYGLGVQHNEGKPSSTDGLGSRLSAIRIARGETKAALARAVGLNPSTVADIENGAQTGVDVLESLANKLGVSPAWLAFGEGPQVLPPRRRIRSAPAAAMP